MMNMQSMMKQAQKLQKQRASRTCCDRICWQICPRPRGRNSYR